MKYLKRFNEETKPGFVENRMKLKEEYEENLLKWYMNGFNDELDGSSTVESDNKIDMIAYSLGASHALIGDEVTSELTNDEIIKMIVNEYNKR